MVAPVRLSRALLGCALPLVLLAQTGCGAASSPAAPATPTPSSALQGPLTILAAASLTEALTTTDTELHRDHPGLDITPSFAGSQTLVTQLLGGAAADLVATADRASMQRLVAAGLVDPPQTIARNRLAIVVATGNPHHVAGLADLARPDLSVVLADPAVPVGRAAATALHRAGVTAHPRSLELDVKAVLRRVTSGEADAGIVYVTDIRAAGSSAAGVDIPAVANVEVAYPAAVVRAGAHRVTAQAYLEQLLHGLGRRDLLARGFLAP